MELGLVKKNLFSSNAEFMFADRVIILSLGLILCIMRLPEKAL